MTKREQVLAIIRAGVAKEGRVGMHEIRLYVENRVSYASFMKAVGEGVAIHARLNQEVRDE